MSGEALLTARELVGELARLGIGQWSADAVRQWIREDVACPIAAPGQRGQAHRYRLTQVLDWLRVRSGKELAKGWTPPPSADPVAADEGASVSHAKQDASPAAPDLPDPLFKDPRNLKAFHEARVARLKADELEGLLVRADEVERLLESQAVAVRQALLAMPTTLGHKLDGAEDLDARVGVIRTEVLQILNRLADGEGGGV